MGGLTFPFLLVWGDLFLFSYGHLFNSGLMFIFLVNLCNPKLNPRVKLRVRIKGQRQLKLL
jgi:hypothetical protein